MAEWPCGGLQIHTRRFDSDWGLQTLKRRHLMNDIIFDYIDQERKRQKEGIELIPSENYVSKNVLRAMGSILTNKYSEGYPGKRYYGGNQFIDLIEQEAINRAKKLFNADHANVQPHSGAQANAAVYNAWCRPGDTILGLSLEEGGHLTHGSPVTMLSKIYNFKFYHLNKNAEIDMDNVKEQVMLYRPSIILVGYSAYSKIPDFKKFVEIRDTYSPNSLLMADMAHVAGLIAGGVHPNPLDFGFNVMTSTTHKTLRGPRGGLILSKGIVGNPLKKCEHTLENIPTLIDRSVFPGVQGGPLEHIIAAKAVCFQEAMQPSFKEYTKQIIRNASCLCEELCSFSFDVQGGNTENHCMLVNMMTTCGMNGKDFEKDLDECGITLNANAVMGDKGGVFKPSGIRLGTPAVTTRGMKEKEMTIIADAMVDVRDHKFSEAKRKIHELAEKFPIPEEF